MANTFNIAPQWATETANLALGALPTITDNNVSSDLIAWNKFRSLLQKTVAKGKIFSSELISTMTIYSGSNGLWGGVIDPAGSVICIPHYIGSVPFYSRIYTDGSVGNFSLPTGSQPVQQAWAGGALSMDSVIHFAPHYSAIGLRVTVYNGLQTYSLAYTTSGAFMGGVLAPSGDLHFIPYNANTGMKLVSGVNSTTTSTYSLIYTTTSAFAGGCLSPTGEIHFTPFLASIGQKITTAGTASTYNLTYTNASGAYFGSVISPEGEIHFIPYSAAVGQKIKIDGTTSTYNLVYTGNGLYCGGVLSPAGEIYFVPHNAAVGQKIKSDGTVATYALPYTTTSAFAGGALSRNGEIYFIPLNAKPISIINSIPTPSPAVMKIATNATPLSHALCMSPFINKF